MKTILLLVNPVSGEGKNLENSEQISKKLLAKNWQCKIIKSENIGFFTNYLSKNELKNYDAIGVVGGDGTMHEVINALISQQNVPPILLFPCGTGNSFTSDLEVDTIDDAIKKLETFNVQEIDSCEIIFSTSEKCYSFNAFGWGLVSKINQTAEKLRWLGNSRYNISSLYHIFKNSKFKAIVKVNDQVFDGDFCFVLACNTMHTGKGMKIAPLALLNDGLYDILVVPHLKFWQLLGIFPQIFSGKHLGSPHIKYIKAATFSIDAPPLPLVIDGEMKFQTPFRANVISEKLKVIV